VPSYIQSPYKPPVALLLAGTPFYFFGSFDDRSSPTQGNVISDSSVTTTATLTYMTVSGNIPKIGDKITVVGTRNANLNVTNATLLTVTPIQSVDGTQSGAVTVTYAITSTSLSLAFDAGQVIIPRPEVSEALANGASVPGAVSFINSQTQQGRTFTVDVKFPSLPTTVTSVDLQGSNFDLDSEFVNITPTSGTVASVSGGVASGGHTVYGDDAANYRFYRLNVVGASGGSSPTIVGRIEI
jgi:hypothetical protein